MISFEDSELSDVAIHFVGNKIQEEALDLSDELLQFDPEIKQVLQQYFTKFFKEQPFHHFHHSTDLNMNEVYTYANDIFGNPESLYTNSVKIAKHLYEVSQHPNIKNGELYVAYFEQVYLEDEICDVIGIFKSENKDSFLKVYPKNSHYIIEKDEGININKLDKGCLIFNSEKEHGYKLMVIDNTNKNNDAHYWTENFLKIKPREDNFYHTQNYLMMCKDFAMDAFPESSKADKLALVNESQQYFKEQDAFDKISFHEKVLQEPEIIEAFEDYKSSYQKEKEIQVVDEFDIAPSAVKNLKRVFKSVIKLDKNFHIYVHGNRSLIRKGYDEESGMNFYQIFYKEEQ